VFEHWELSRENMEIFIAPQGLKADDLIQSPESDKL
jgi:uridine kinase